MLHPNAKTDEEHIAQCAIHENNKNVDYSTAWICRESKAPIIHFKLIGEDEWYSTNLYNHKNGQRPLALLQHLRDKEIIADLEIKFGHLYDYSNAWLSSGDRRCLIIHFKLKGEDEWYSNSLNSHKMGNVPRELSTRIINERIIAKLEIEFGHLYDYSKAWICRENSAARIHFTLIDCVKPREQNLEEHKKGSKVKMPQGEVDAQIIAEFEIEFGHLYDYSKAWICRDNPRDPKIHFKLLGCNKPRNQGLKNHKIGRKLRLTTEEINTQVIAELEIEFGHLYDYSKAWIDREGKTRTIYFTLLGCDEVRQQQLSGHKKGEHPTPLFVDHVKDCQKIHDDKYQYIDIFIDTGYLQPRTFVNYICPDHPDETITQELGSHKKGTGCPYCSNSERNRSETLLIENIFSVFDSDEVSFHAKPTFLLNSKTKRYQHYDLFFEEYNIALEYMGKQHYQAVDFFGGEVGFRTQLKHDKLKRAKSRKNGVIQINIKHSDFYCRMNEAEQQAFLIPLYAYIQYLMDTYEIEGKGWIVEYKPAMGEALLNQLQQAA